MKRLQVLPMQHERSRTPDIASHDMRQPNPCVRLPGNPASDVHRIKHSNLPPAKFGCLLSRPRGFVFMRLFVTAVVSTATWPNMQRHDDQSGFPGYEFTRLSRSFFDVLVRFLHNALLALSAQLPTRNPNWDVQARRFRLDDSIPTAEVRFLVCEKAASPKFCACTEHKLTHQRRHPSLRFSTSRPICEVSRANLIEDWCHERSNMRHGHSRRHMEVHHASTPAFPLRLLGFSV